MSADETEEQPKDQADETEGKPAAEESAPAKSAPRTRRAAGTAAPRATRARTPRATAASGDAQDAAAASAEAAEPEVAAEAAKASDDGEEQKATPSRAPRPPRRREKPADVPRTLPRLLARFREEIRDQLHREFGYSSVMQVPEVKKVVINVGLGEALTNARALETTPLHIGMISGQHPVITKARISVAGFKVREGNPIGVMVTLRGDRMYEFLDRMISMALPRIRDFRGVPRTSFDGKGNYSLGLREQIMFPEIDYGSIDRIRGLQVTITTSAANDPEGFRLLELMGMPFAREGQAR